MSLPHVSIMKSVVAIIIGNKLVLISMVVLPYSEARSDGHLIKKEKRKKEN